MRVAKLIPASRQEYAEGSVGFCLSRSILRALLIVFRCKWLPKERDSGDGDHHENHDPCSGWRSSRPLFLEDCDAALDGEYGLGELAAIKGIGRGLVSHGAFRFW